MGTGTGEAHVFAVERTRLVGKVPMPYRSAVVITSRDGELRWQRPYDAGYGITGMSTDLTGHVFISFAVTNHSGVAWVLDARPSGVNDFGTVDGSHIRAGNYSGPDQTQTRYLYTYRQGWPADMARDALRDIFLWRHGNYRFAGCERQAAGGGFVDRHGTRFKRYPAGSPQCPRPVHRYEFEAH